MATTTHIRTGGGVLVVALVGLVTTFPPNGNGGRQAHAATTAGLQAGRCAGARAVHTPTPSRSATGSSGQNYAYDWPVKPFDRQHPVRAYLDDPRIGKRERLFHFGIDIAAADGTLVYAVAAGRVFRQFDHVAVVGSAGEFAYWHIVPVVRHHELVSRHQLIGYVMPPWGHVHFAEIHDGHYLNPLRPGALGPYADWTAPTLAAAGAESGSPHLLTGHVSLVAAAHDTAPIRIAGAWHDEPVTPALVRWRLLSGNRAVRTWRTAADFRHEMLQPSQFDRIYAPATTQNHEGEPGLFCFNLARHFDTRTFPDGTYRLEIELRDTRRNASVTEKTLTIDNRS